MSAGKLAAFAAAIATSVFADTVDNPGSFQLTVNSGYIKIGSQRFDIDPGSAPVFQGMVDGDGFVVIPASGIAFPDTTVDVPVLGTVTVRIEFPEDAAGTLNPLTGLADLTITIRVRLLNRLLPAGCGIGPISPVLTTDVSGDLTGVPYDQNAGTALYVSNDFSVPRSSGCGAFAGAIDGFAGLPSPAPNNEIQLAAQFDPIFTGS